MSAGCLPRVAAFVSLASVLMALPVTGDEEQDFAAAPQVPAPTMAPTPEPTPRVTDKPERMRPQPTRPPSRNDDIRGLASWHATGRDGPYAAACRPLRRAFGGHGRWRGKQVLVAHKTRAIIVTLNDFCASTTKTIDLSDEAFDYLGNLSAGVLRVVVSR